MTKQLSSQTIGIILAVCLILLTGGAFAYLYMTTKPSEVAVVEGQYDLTGVSEMAKQDNNIFEKAKGLHQDMTAAKLNETVTYESDEIGDKKGIISPILK